MLFLLCDFIFIGAGPVSALLINLSEFLGGHRARPYTFALCS